MFSPVKFRPCFQLRKLMTNAYMGVDEFLNYRNIARANVEDFHQVNKNLQNVYISKGSKYISRTDFIQMLDYAETQDDMTLLSKLIVDVCNHKYSRKDFLDNTIGLFVTACVHFNDLDSAKIVKDAYSDKFNMTGGKFLKRFYHLNYVAGNYQVIVDDFEAWLERNEDRPHDDIKAYYVASLYKIGTKEAYDKVGKNRNFSSTFYNMPRYIYATFAIEQNDWEEADFTLSRKLGVNEFIADIHMLRLYLLFKQGKISQAVGHLEYWLKSAPRKISCLFSFEMMEKLSEAVKETKNEDLIQTFTNLCVELEERATMVEMSVFEIVTQPKNSASPFDTPNKNKDLLKGYKIHGKSVLY